MCNNTPPKKKPIYNIIAAKRIINSPMLDKK